MGWGWGKACGCWIPCVVKRTHGREMGFGSRGEMGECERIIM